MERRFTALRIIATVLKILAWIALLFGILKNGATKMMVVSGTPIDIVTILQAVILIFVAAPAIIRAIYRMRQPLKEETAAASFTLSGWGGGK